MATVKHPCFGKLPEEDQKSLREKSNAIFKQGYTRKEADIRSAREYQDETLSHIEDIHKQLGISSPKKVSNEKTKEAEETKNVSGTGKYVSGDRFGDKPIFSDFNATIADKETGKLLPFGEEIKDRINKGEPITIVTKSGSEGDAANEKRILDALGLKEKPENLTIKQGLSPEEKVALTKKGGGVLVDNSPSVLSSAEGEKVKSVNANELNREGASVIKPDENKPPTIVPLKKVEPEKVETKKEPVTPDKDSGIKEPPPIPPPPPIEEIREPSDNPKEEFTSIRKEKQKEIEGAKELFEKQKTIKWSETYNNAIHNVQSMYPGKNLYDAMKSRVDEFVTKLDSKILFNPTSEDNAVFNVFKDQTKRRINQIEGWDSTDDIKRLAAAAEFGNLSKDLFNVVRVTNPGGEAGRAFNLLQSEIANDPEHGLQIRRMELLGSKAGEKLSEADLEFTSEQWEKEKALIQKENDLKIKSMQEKFDKEIEKLKAAKKEPSTKEKREKLLSQSGKEFADKLRAGKLKGTYATFPGLPQAINFVIDRIADLVELGSTLAQAISNFVKEHKIKDEDKFKNDFIDVLNRREKKEDSYSKIEELAKASNSTDITNDMVAKNLIRDYVNAHAGLHDNKDILDIAHTELKKILPDVEKNKLVEAYLKDGEFKQPTKKQLENSFKESEKTLNRLTSIEKDINDLKEKGELYKKNNKTSKNPYDRDIENKERERKDLMNSLGVKSSNEDKYAKASYDQRAAIHNQRLEDLSKSIQDKLDKGDLPENLQKQLIKLKGQLDASKINLDPNSALSKERTLQGGIDLLKSIKSEFSRTTTGDILKVGDINRSLQRTIDKFNSDKQESEQDIKLQRAKDKAKMDTDEFKRKIAAGEFEDNPIVGLTKTDAELIKLQRDRSLIADKYYTKQRDYENKNLSWRRKLGNFFRAAWVADLIGKPFTFIKVAWSAGVRPAFEATSSLTFGKGFRALPFATTKAISERSKLGGESSSLKSVAKGYEAYLRQYSPEQLQDKYQKASDKYEKSDSEYQKIKSDPNANPKKLAELKNKRDDDLKEALSNVVFQYIGGSSLREAWDVFLHRSTELERKLGQFDREAWKKGGSPIENLQYVMNFVGRSHAALKNFSARYSFASGFMARLEGNIADGKEISNPDKLLEIAHQSYIDWERGKYQESNWASDTWNKVTNGIEKVSPELAYLFKLDVAITRVPVNMLREGIMEYTLGSFRASVMAAREYYKARNIVLQDGYTPESEAQFKTELSEQLQKIDPKTAATILRSFRKGGFGLGLYSLALFGHAAFGGWAHKGQTAEDKAKKKRDTELGVPDEIKTGQVKIGDWTMPEWASKVAEHTPAFTPLGFGLGLSQVYQNNIIDGKSTPESALNSAMAQVDHIIGSIPQIENIVKPIAKQTVERLIPHGQWDDVDQAGNPMKREAFRIDDYLHYLPGTDAKNILSEHYYKEAIKNQKYYRREIEQVELNTSLSQKEKDDARDEFLKQLKETTDEIYKQNKENPQ